MSLFHEKGTRAGITADAKAFELCKLVAARLKERRKAVYRMLSVVYF